MLRISAKLLCHEELRQNPTESSPIAKREAGLVQRRAPCFTWDARRPAREQTEPARMVRKNTMNKQGQARWAKIKATKMTKIAVTIEFEGPSDPEELFSCLEVALVEFKKKGLPFATTGEDEPIVITDWNSEYTSDAFVYGE